MIGRTVQSYRIVSQLGAGGMGVVYEAEDTRLGRRVALKFLPAALDVSAEAAARFEREARIASSLNHPNICTIHDIGVADDDGRAQRFIVMELLEGESLRSRIHGQPLPLDLVVDVGIQMADAIDAAHALGIVHRDIKPANIFITRRGQAKLLDFGIAKPGREDEGDADETRVRAESLTMPGTAVGSINYMSPEQARGEPVDGRTDIFSLGVVLYEMATGRQAFNGQTTAVVFDAILNRDPVPARQLNPDLPEELDRMIRRTLEKDRALRYQTAGDLLAELRRIRRDTDVRRVTTAAATAATAAPAITAAGAAAAQAPAPAPAPTHRTEVVAAPMPAGSAPPARRSRAALFGVPVALVAAIAGFWFWNSAKAPAFAERDTILIADFANTTGDAVFDDALKQAVSVQLQQTPFVTLLADQQVQRTLRLMQQPADAAVVGAIAREVCQRAGARASVEGSIAPLGSSYVIALGVHDCQSGAPIAQKQTQAESKEAVLKAVAAAVTELRGRLGESLASIARNDVPAEATTSSLDALKAYGLAVRTRTSKGDEAAIALFRQAIDKDPNFALAHAKLGIVYANLGRADEAKQETARAYELRDRASEYERLYITWSYMSRVAADDVKAKDALEVLTTTYPRDFAAHNNYGTHYMNRGQFDEALKHFKIAHEIASGEPLPASNAAYCLLFSGRYDEALPLAEQALSIRPDRGLSVARWVHAHMRHDPRETEFRAVATKMMPDDLVTNVDANLALWDGKPAEYWRLQSGRRDRAVAENRKDDAAAIEADALASLAAVQGQKSMAELARAAAKPGAIPMLVMQSAVAHAVHGDASELRDMARLEKIGATGGFAAVLWPYARAFKLSADGKHAEAIAVLQSLQSVDPRKANVHAYIAIIEERAGRRDDAIASYRRVIAAQPALGLDFSMTVARMALVRLLKETGDAAGAKAQADVLRAQWTNADKTFVLLPEIEK